MSEQQPRSAKGWTRIAKKLDIRAEAEELGIEFIGEASGKGYLTCWAYDRPHGDSASAGMNLESGWYKDHGGSGEGCYLYQLAAKMGKFTSPDQALFYYAEKVDLTSQIAASIAHRNQTLASVATRPLSEIAVRRLARLYPGFTFEAVDRCGGVCGRWPTNAQAPNSVIAFKSFDRDGNQTGWTLQSISPNGICKYRGPDREPEWLKRLNLGTTGMLNEHAVHLLLQRENTVELIIKVEGVSDMLALNSIMPAEYRDRIVVWTNASGCQDVPAHALNLFRGVPTVVLHDSDVPGQEGAEKWCSSLVPFVPSLKNLILFEEIAENKGPDVRDWLSHDGNDFELLLQLIESCPEYTTSEEGMSAQQIARQTLGPDATDQDIEDHQLLRNCRVIVLGVEESGEVVCYSENTHRTFRIKNVAYYKYENALLDMGSNVMDYVSGGAEEYETTRVSMFKLKQAIARTASKNTLKAGETMGAGAWSLGNRVVLVNHDHVSVANGTFDKSYVPTVGGRLIEFSDHQWYEHDEIDVYYRQTTDTEWCKEVFDETIELFERWDNWRYMDCPMIISALICGTWIQSLLSFRPMVAVIGATNTGKTVCRDTLKHFFGEHFTMSSDNATEAGIRQKVKTNSTPILLDEFDKSRHRSAILDLIRTSTRGGVMVRGTTGQDGTSFGLKHIVWLMGIESGLEDAADRNRFILMPLEKLPETHTKRMEIPTEEDCAELGKKLLAIGMRWHGTINAFQRELSNLSVSGIDRRLIEAYATPVAIIGAATGKSVNDCRVFLQEMLERRRDITEISNESDEDQLVSAICEQNINIKGNVFTILELISMPEHALTDVGGVHGFKTTPSRELANRGIKVCSLDGGRGVEGDDGIAINPGSVKKILKGTKYADMAIKEILTRIEGSRETKMSINGRQMRCVVVPKSRFVTGDVEDVDQDSAF